MLETKAKQKFSFNPYNLGVFYIGGFMLKYIDTLTTHLVSFIIPLTCIKLILDYYRILLFKD